jgi:arylsulfatase A-like enzyme
MFKRSRREFVLSGVTLALGLVLYGARCQQLLAADKPNIIFILADDLGYGDLGCYGQKQILTPRLDQMAAQGMRFTQFYAGCTVCAPSRCVLMTGLHTGRAWVRGNAGSDNSIIQSLRDEDMTVAEVLRGAGYRNGLIGKWGLGEVDQPGFPLRQGFDYFYGYLNQVHAHNYYPEFLYRNAERVKLANLVKRPEGQAEDFLSGSAIKRVDYSHDLIASEAVEFVRQNAQNQFFLYLALTTPHANNEATRMTGNGAEVPTFGIYANREWSDQDKGQAAMITRMDADVGRLLDLLQELGIDEKTLVMFSSDNGPHNEAGHNLGTFNPSGPLTGIKRSLTEGGIRVPMIARWPGKIAAGATNSFVGSFADMLPTFKELSGSQVEAKTTGLSLVPTLLGIGQQKSHEYLYWEFYEQGSKQSVRFGDWTAIRQPMFNGEVSLFNLATDLAQKQNVARENPAIVSQAVALMEQAHQPNENWKPRGGGKSDSK